MTDAPAEAVAAVLREPEGYNVLGKDQRWVALASILAADRAVQRAAVLEAAALAMEDADG